MSHQSKSLCKSCRHKFRRVFIPLRSEEYVDDDGNPISPEEDNILIINSCLISGMDIEAEETVECDHHTPKQENDQFPFFKHIK